MQILLLLFLVKQNAITIFIHFGKNKFIYIFIYNREFTLSKTFSFFLVNSKTFSFIQLRK